MTDTTRTILQHEVAALLVDSEQIQYLLPFMPCPRTLTEAARRLGVSAPHLRYHVRRFVECGLLEQAERRSRRGRSEVLYRSTAKRFYVPFSATPYENFEAMVLSKDLAWQTHVSRAFTRVRLQQRAIEQGGVRFSSDPKGRLITEFVSHPEASAPSKKRLPEDHTPAHWSTWSTLKLQETDALALEQELHDLWQRYLQKSGEGQYLLRLALTPFVFDHSGEQSD